MITVMTYNVANGLVRPEALTALLRDSGADIVGLQEVAADQAAAIEATLADAYPHRFLLPLGIPGKGLLSKLPLLDVEPLPFYPRRPDLRARVVVAGTPTTVIVAHPPPPRFRHRLTPDEATRRQVASLIAAATAGGPAVLMGDFNAIAWTATYRRIAAAGLADAFRAAGRGTGVTLPKRLARWADGRNPLGKLPLPAVLRVDYVWVTGEVRPLAVWVGPHAGSDHLPVLARLAIDGAGGEPPER